MKRSISLLASLLILSSLAACGEKTPEKPITADTETVRVDPKASVPDTLPDNLDFGGETFRLLLRTDQICQQQFVAEQSGETLEDAVYSRNRAVEERLNVHLEFPECPGWEKYDDALSLIRRSVRSGDNAFDVVAGWSAKVPALSAEGIFLDIYTLPLLDLSQSWWISSLVEELTVGGRLYFITGDAALSAQANSYCFTFNKTLAENYDVPDLYQTVRDGKWTLDRLDEVARMISDDTNGDGVMNSEDTWGFTILTANPVDSFLQSCGIRMMKKDKDGYPEFAFETEKIGTIVEKLYKTLFENPGVAADSHLLDRKKIADFTDGRVLLGTSRLADMTPLRNSDVEFGILPYPKYDEAQEKYLTRIADGVDLLCVPTTLPADRYELVGGTLEALAADGYRIVTPAFFEITLKGKTARDTESEEMLDLVREGAYLNFASIYNESIGKPWHILRDLFEKRSGDYASWYASGEKKMNYQLDKLLKKFRKLE